MYRISPLVSKDTLKTLSGALVQPHLDYAVHTWYRSAPKALKTRLQTSQNKLVRLLLNLPPRAHLDPGHFERVGWLRVDDRVQHLAMGLVFKIYNTNKIPMYLKDYFLKVKDRHNYNTRGSSTDLVQPRHGTNKGLNSFSCYATNMWNALPKAVKECKSLSSFKTALKEHLQTAAILTWPQ